MHYKVAMTYIKSERRLVFMHCWLACFPFLRWVKFCGCFRQVFFISGEKKKWPLVALDRWSSYTVPIVWEFAWADSTLVVLDEWSSYRGGRLNRFDSILYYSKQIKRLAITKNIKPPRGFIKPTVLVTFHIYSVKFNAPRLNALRYVYYRQ